MYKKTIAFAALMFVVVASGCSGQLPERQRSDGYGGVPEAPTEQPQGEQPQGEQESLYNQITSADYGSWATAPGYDEPQPAKGPHGDETQIYLSPEAEKALAEGADEWPVGTVIVKDIYIDGNLAQVAAMRKDEGGWYWAEYQGDGEPLTEGLKAEPCESCHSKGRDGTLAVRPGE